ncbi:MAG: hypothetical protein GJ676_05640 [Rhodobacteraceae bacterium]|nr:hypothetical protein [Paracoccaceae bacterium]
MINRTPQAVPFAIEHHEGLTDMPLPFRIGAELLEQFGSGLWAHLETAKRGRLDHTQTLAKPPARPKAGFV